MFISISEETHDNFLRASRTFCKDCEQYANVRLVERVRTVTFYWVLKSTGKKHFLICDGCESQFRVKPHRNDDLEHADMHSLMQMAGKRHVSFSDQAVLFLALLSLPVPFLNLALMWGASRNRARYTPVMMKLWRITLWGAPAVTLALLIAMALEKPYQP